MELWIIFAFWILAAICVVILVGQAVSAHRMARRLDLNGESDYAVQAQTDPDDVPDPLRRWLYVAGFRAPFAPALFIVGSLLTLVIGLIFFQMMNASGFQVFTFRRLEGWPAGMGKIFIPVVRVLPWFILFISPFVPALYVRSCRKEKVQSIEADLPVTLEMLATLCESGLAFDMAMDRVLTSFPSKRHLALELRTFRADVLSGRPRVQCLRRLARRVDVSTLTVCVSAIVQSEQIGASIADVLRRQSDDLRERRRERAMEFAMSQAIKRVFPMVITLLPGLFIAAIGPTFYETLMLIQNVVTDLKGSGF